MTLRKHRLILVALAGLPLACTPAAPGPNAPDDGDGDPVIVDEDVIVVAPGSGFDDAPRVQFDAARRMVIDNTLHNPDEVHVYDLGELSMGDIVEVIAIDKDAVGLDPMIALFDADGLRIFWNDDVNPQTGNFNAFFMGSIRHDSPAHYLAISASNYSQTTGAYRITVELTPERALAPIKGQTVVLQWTGAQNVSISGVSYGDLTPVDAGDINGTFGSRTTEFQENVLNIVRKDFAPYDITIVSSEDPEPTGNSTQIFFGGEAPGEFVSAKIFGSSDGIDFYNASDQDNAIVFLGVFSELSSNFDAVVQAVANVTSHEIGHTLGLMHTVDATSLMDTTGADVTLLEDQGFSTARLFDFPIGLQNSDQLLVETVGRAPAVAAGASPQATTLHCGTCGAALVKVRIR